MQDIHAHCREIDRCNQRGGRMLSIVDLLDAGTINPELAGYLLAAIGKGTSFMVGALPGGAGKTTVMGALLNFVPLDVELVPAENHRVLRQGLEQPTPKRCYICHEIGSGPYYAYLWGEELRDLLRLPSAGHMVATNLHADTLDQARRQICNDNDVPESLFNSFGLMLFLHLQRGRGGTQRRIAAVYEPASPGGPRQVYHMADNGQTERAKQSVLVSEAELNTALQRIRALRTSGGRTIEEVRQALTGS